MHHKFAVRDGSSVWTGSTNWTDDSCTRCENIIVVVESEPVAAAVHEGLRAALDDRLGGAERLRRPDSDRRRRAEVRVVVLARARRSARDPHRAPDQAGAARDPRVLAGAHLRPDPRRPGRVRLRREGRRHRRRRRHADARRLPPVDAERELRRGSSPLVARVLGNARASPGKDSTPYGDGDNVHDFMHAKVTVADDHVFAGSYNLSHSGELNAENVLEIRDPELADRLAAWIDERAGPLRAGAGSRATGLAADLDGRDAAFGERRLSGGQSGERHPVRASRRRRRARARGRTRPSARRRRARRRCRA